MNLSKYLIFLQIINLVIILVIDLTTYFID